MFGLSLVDHLRLTFAHVIYSHKTHAHLADRHARWSRWLKGAEALLVLTTALSAVALVFTQNVTNAIVAAVAASIALCTLVLRLAFDLDRTSLAHRMCSGQLWHLREQYRALLADLHDGAISIDTARQRRDALMQLLHKIYDQAPPADREVYQSARQALATADEAALTDEEIDRFLPASLQKAGRSAPA
jgi:hypothetical protein